MRGGSLWAAFFPTGVSPVQFAEAERNNFKSRTTIQSDGVELQLSLMDMDGRFTDEQKLERARKAMTAQAQRKLDMIGKISKALGMDVVVHDYMRGSNGYFGEDGKIHFVLSGHMSVARVAAHELTHQMQSVASEKYTVVRDQLIEDVGQDRFDRLLKRKAAQYGYNMESEQGRLACDEEVIAELCEGMLSDKDRLERFAERHTDTALTLKERLTKILNAIHATLKDTFGQNQNRISDMITDEKTADKWLDGLDEVLKKVQEKQVQENKSAIQYSVDETGMSAERKAEYDEYIQNALGGPGNNNEIRFTIGKVDARIAKWLERFGKKISSDAVHVIADNDIRHIRNRHGIAKEGQYGVTTGDLQAIPYILKNANEKYFFPKPNGKSGILYVTDGVDTTYYVEEIISEDALTGKQMIKTKKGTVPSAYENIINNKEAFLAPPDKAADAVPRMYVQDARQYDASANKISQADKSVKGKFSLDEAYRKAVTSGNVQEQQKLVEQAAKEAGYTKLFYHGSKKGGGFTTFKNWQYFTENKQYAQRYAGGENGLYTTYVKMENPFDTRQAEARSLFNEARQELGLGKLQENGLPDWTDGYDLSEYIEENDLPYDSIILDEGGDMVNGKPVSRGLSYVIRNPEQIKSADAVTYDDAGNAIPLSERFNMGKKDIRYALDTDYYDYSRSFAQQIDDYVAGKFPRNDTFVLGKTPDIFQKVGLSALPMTMDQVHVDYALNGTKNADHQLGADLLKNLPSLLEKPVAIIESATHPNNSVMAIVKGEVNGKQVTAAVRVGGMGILNKETIDSNHVVSVQGRQNAVSKLLVQAIEKENAGETGVYYINKTEAQDLCARSGLQLPGSAAQDGLIHSIFDAGSPVNRKYMEQTETRQFKRWFGDWQNDPAHASKVVNEDGTPKVMYHGTSKGGFNVFNTYGSNFGLFGIGSYFTDNPDVAQSYTQKGKGNNPQVYAVYLDIRNPIDMDADANISEWKKTLRDASSYFNGCKTNEDCFKALKEYCQDEMMYKYEAEEYITDAIKAMGYDGITHIGGGRYNKNDATRHRVFIAFDPEQIKSATDNIGTFDRNNPDIRYSLDTEQLEKTVRAIDTKALEEGLQSMNAVSNVNSFTMKDPSRFFDAISKNNTELRNELHDIFEKPHSEATGLYARNLEKMQERVKNIAKEAGVISQDGKKFDKLASAAVQNIGEGIAPIACSVEAKVVGADTISLKATRNDSEILSGDFTLEAQFFGIWKRLVEHQSSIKPLTWERLLPGYRRIL